MKKEKLLHLFSKIISMKKFAFGIILLFLVANLTISIVSWRSPKQRIGYVDMGTLYSKFKMKQEMELNMSNIIKSKENKLEALMGDLKTKIKSEKDTATVMENYRTEQQKSADDTKKIAAKYNEQIWKQLNQYVKEYSDLNHFTVMLGADGSGLLMAADTTLNQTNSLITYANQRYQGQNTIFNAEN
jgi:Skp family chaperone for outer membrane proteins